MTTLQVGGRLPHFYVIVFRGLRLQASTRNRVRCVFKSFQSGERFQKFAVTVCVFTGYVQTKAGSVIKCLRIQTNPDTCGQGLGMKSTFIMAEIKIVCKVRSFILVLKSISAKIAEKVNWAVHESETSFNLE